MIKESVKISRYKRLRVFILILMLMALTACDKEGDKDLKTEVSDSFKETNEGIVSGRELIALTDNKEEAEKLAKLYEIELVDYSYGVASFHTKEDPHAVIERGRKNGYKLLDLNMKIELENPPSSDTQSILQ